MTCTQKCLKDQGRIKLMLHPAPLGNLIFLTDSFPFPKLEAVLIQSRKGWWHRDRGALLLFFGVRIDVIYQSKDLGVQRSFALPCAVSSALGWWHRGWKKSWPFEAMSLLAGDKASCFHAYVAYRRNADPYLEQVRQRRLLNKHDALHKRIALVLLAPSSGRRHWEGKGTNGEKEMKRNGKEINRNQKEMRKNEQEMNELQKDVERNQKDIKRM